MQSQILYTGTDMTPAVATPNVDISKEIKIQSVGPTTLEVEVPSDLENALPSTDITNEPIINEETNQVVIT